MLKGLPENKRGLPPEATREEKKLHLKEKVTILGVLSDTHGLIRPEVLSALDGSDLIIHAGDVGKRIVLEALETVAPVIAVKGNIDRAELAKELLDTWLTEVGQIRIYVIHNVNDLDIDPAAESIRMIISGHSHIPSILEKSGIIYLNPGSAGPRRFNLPISLARVQISGTRINPRLINIET